MKGRIMFHGTRYLHGTRVRFCCGTAYNECFVFQLWSPGDSLFIGLGYSSSQLGAI